MLNPLEELHELVRFCHLKKEEFHNVLTLTRERYLRQDTPIFDDKIPSDISKQPYVVNYANRRHIFAYNALSVPMTLTDNAGEWTTILQPQVWTNISFPPGTRLLSNVSGTIKAVCTDDVYPGSIPAVMNVTTSGTTTVAGTVSTQSVSYIVLKSNQTGASYTSADLPVGLFRELAIDIVFTGFTGGTTPTITYQILRNDLWNNYNEIYSSGAISAAKTIILSLGAGMGTGTVDATNVAEGVSFGNTLRVQYTTTGAPTAVTQTISVIGKS